MKRLFFILFFLVAALPALALEKVEIALNWKPEPEFGGFYAAQVAGIYKKHGLDVEIIPGGSGTPVIQMLAAGKIDFGIVSGDELVISRANGSDVIAIFATFQTNPQGIMTHADRGFRSIGDVFKSEGTLAIQRGLPYAEFLLKKYGEPKVKIVPYLGGVANFLNDKNYSQQVFITAEPIEAKKRDANVRTFLVADEGYNPYTVVLATRSSVLKKNPKLVESVVKAVREGWQEYLKNPAPANKVMSGLNKAMDASTFVMSAEAQKPLIETAETKKSGLGTMTEARWRKLVDQLADLKLIKGKPEAKDLFVNL